MRRSIATVSLSGTLEEKLAAAAQVGFDGVEIFEADLLTSPLSPADIRRRCAGLGLSIDLYQPFRDFEGVPPERLAANLRRAARKFDVMADLGVRTMLVCSSVAPGTDGDDKLAAAQLRELAELARSRGMRVAYEALAWGRHVNDYRHAWEIVAAADHPALGVCLDSFHILSRGDDPEGIRAIPGDKIFFLQLADAPKLGMDVLQWSRHYRCFPGQGDFDLTAFVGHVLAAGYDGPLSLEVFNDVFRQADAERTATDALRSLIALHDDVAPPAKLDGYAFVELGVDALGGEVAERMLRGLGFARVARHRSKPVHLWQQGEARILLNRARSTGDEAAIIAIGVESEDPAASARRAEKLLAPAVPRRYGPGEADLTAVAAPDGTQVFFCGGGNVDWLGDFDPLPDRQAGMGITGVDQVSLSQPLHYFDEAVLFYRSVLGLRRHDPEDIPDPRGLVRARAMTSAGRRVRMLLHVPALGGSRLPETADFQHVAFACGDVFAAAAAMRDAGVPLLAIPDNYYADLAARVDLDADRIEVMRSHGILYDRTDDGELFHFYTAMLGRRVFFELVQRVKDYDGYGTPNTPVRMAAQYRVSRGILGGSTAGSGP
ncbi:bifunctional sugar phosphate isomerase/epimerase/4-hydroxyphenylpyruvate dioxygenase family protein [Actinoplanes sp. CA-142083]|uniref:bifunctional sugar phosphate isomerase/epimerase/4-hydroxyphenylpyruvate dioxygenase family protein n=1 Tax=Actinoplanes sp. CA-142083 TaxID=3239903 RepID=UPI003D8E92D0